MAHPQEFLRPSVPDSGRPQVRRGGNRPRVAARQETVKGSTAIRAPGPRAPVSACPGFSSGAVQVMRLARPASIGAAWLWVRREWRGLGSWTVCSAVLVDAADLVDGVGAAEAETVVIDAITAWQMLHRKSRVRAGRTVLAHAQTEGPARSWSSSPKSPARGDRHRVRTPPRRPARTGSGAGRPPHRERPRLRPRSQGRSRSLIDRTSPPGDAPDPVLLRMPGRSARPWQPGGYS